MNDLTNKSSPEELYREYQNTRDNIPDAVYTEIVSKAEQTRNENNIHAILQQAKIANNAQEHQHNSNKVDSNSLLARITEFFKTKSSRAWGPALASVAIAIIALPLAVNFNNTEIDYSEVAHLGACADCGRYIIDSSVTTRSAAPGLSKLTPEYRLAAKLGRISASLKIAALLESESTIGASRSELERLALTDTHTRLSGALASKDANAESLIAAIQADMRLSDYQAVFAAAKSIQIANISARFAIDTTDIQSAFTPLEAAITEFEAIDELNIRQKSILNDLKSILTTKELKTRETLQKLITVYGRAMESLGA